MEPKSTFLKRYALVLFFLLAYLFTWANWLPRAAANLGLFSLQPPEFVILLAGYGPALAAILTASLTLGRAGLRQLFSRLLRWRVKLWWYLAALLIPVGIQLGALSLSVLLSGQPLGFSSTGKLPFLPGDMPLWLQGLMFFIILVLGFDGLGEELGWRGFALPRLQERFGPFAASLVLGFFWALWHLPYMFSEGSALAGRPLILFFLNTMGISVVYTWIFNNTRASVLLAILFHASGNLTATLLGVLFPAAADPRVYVFVAVINWVLAVVLLLTSPVFASARLPARQATFEE